jgi:hypothetical protein
LFLDYLSRGGGGGGPPPPPPQPPHLPFSTLIPEEPLFFTSGDSTIIAFPTLDSIFQQNGTGSTRISLPFVIH